MIFDDLEKIANSIRHSIDAFHKEKEHGQHREQSPSNIRLVHPHTKGQKAERR